MKSKEQDHKSQFMVTGVKQEFNNCWDGRCLKSSPELETQVAACCRKFRVGKNVV